MKKGYKFSEENKKKRYSEEWRRNISDKLKGKVSPFKGKTGRWTEEQKKRIGDAQRGIPKSEEFSNNCRERMSGIAFFKGKKQSERQKEMMRSRCGGKHYNYKGRCSSGKNKSAYSVRLRREKKGFTEDIFLERVHNQGNKCAICLVEFDESIHMQKKSADHCHINNIPRGVLCRRCNILLGNAKDDTVILESAIKYLNLWKRTE